MPNASSKVSPGRETNVCPTSYTTGTPIQLASQVVVTPLSVFSHPSVKDPLSVRAHRPIKAIYIKRFVALIDQIQE